jgi:hypothetical protein
MDPCSKALNFTRNCVEKLMANNDLLVERHYKFPSLYNIQMTEASLQVNYSASRGKASSDTVPAQEDVQTMHYS